MSTVILKGNVVYAPALGKLCANRHAYVIAEDGIITGIFDELPGKYGVCEIADFGDSLITPAFCDLHLHAPQWSMVGMGMDLRLLEWLSTYAYKAEALYADTGFAAEAYAQLASSLLRAGTTRVSAFSSLHSDSTLVLMRAFERAGVCGCVGKVNMDRNNAPELCESTRQSKDATLRWLEGCGGFSYVAPIITPRFTPSCTDELMEWLGGLAQERGLNVQSHLSENPDEVAWVKRLHPDCEYYYQSYEKYGLWKRGTLMAHCVYSDEKERAAMRRAGVTAVHCPDSNLNISSGIAPIRRMLDEGVNVCLGSDIAGGALLSIADVASLAVRCSKLRALEDPAQPFLTFGEAFYLATSAGQVYFGEKPGFAAGNSLHALVLDDGELPAACELTLEERLERLMYMQSRRISAVYSAGRRVI